MSALTVRPEASATITVTEPVVAVPARDEVVYSYGFEDYDETSYPESVVSSQDFEPGNTDGWYMETGSTLSSTGMVYVNIYRASYNDGLPASASIEARGLTIGQSYTVSGDVNHWPSVDPGTVQFSVEGVGSSTTATTTPEPKTHTYTFIATAATHTVTVTATGYPADIEVHNFEISGWTPTPGVDPNEWGIDGTGPAYGRTGQGGYFLGLGGTGATGGTILRYNQPWTVGVSHTVSVWMRRETGTGEVGLYEGSGPPSMSSLGTTWKKISFTFTPTSAASNINFTYVEGGTYYFDDFQIVRSAFTDVHNNGLDGWTSSAALFVVPGAGVTGNGLLVMSAGATTMARAFPGLTIGHQYTLRGKKQLTEGGPWTTVSQTYTAASTAQAFSLPTEEATWDDMELIHHVPAVMTLTPVLPISQGKVRLDENYSPYVTANFEVPLTSLALLEQIDPRDPQRVTVTMTEAVSGVSRTLNLGLRSRSVNHRAGTISVELASDEILLHDRKNGTTTVDKSARAYEASLRSVCAWAINKVGGTFATGTVTADVTARWTLSNEFTNPGPSSVTGYTSGSGTSAVVFGSGYGRPVIRWTASATGVSYLNVASGFSVRPGYLYTIAGDLSSSVGRNVGFMLRWMNADGGTIKDQVLSTVTTNTSGWVRSVQTVTAPPTAEKVNVYVASNVNTAGQFHYVSQLMWTEGIQSVPYFDGSTSGGGYTYSWEGAAGNSPSTRKPADGVERLPEVFNWTPGQSLFDFLQPLINASGLRLFADENRVFRLVDPAEYEVPGYVVVQTGYNATEGTDSITRNDDTWADCVVVIYKWTDANGNTQTKYDAAGDATGKTITRELEREYPGPGAAAAILASYQGRGRTQSVTVVGEYQTTPGMDVTINLPGTLTQTGKVRAAEFDLGSGLAVIETRGLTDALPGSWVLWNPTQTWSQVNNTLKWKDA